MKGVFWRHLRHVAAPRHGFYFNDLSTGHGKQKRRVGSLIYLREVYDLQSCQWLVWLSHIVHPDVAQSILLQQTILAPNDQDQ